MKTSTFLRNIFSNNIKHFVLPQTHISRILDYSLCITISLNTKCLLSLVFFGYIGLPINLKKKLLTTFNCLRLRFVLLRSRKFIFKYLVEIQTSILGKIRLNHFQIIQRRITVLSTTTLKKKEQKANNNKVILKSNVMVLQIL